MALIKCPECGKEISDKAVSCPHCGFPTSKAEVKDTHPRTKSFTVAYRGGPGSIAVMSIIGFIFGILGLIGAIFMLIKTNYLVVSAVLIIILASALFALSILTFVRIILNYKLGQRNCIEYNAEKDRLILCTLSGTTIVIKVDDYISLKDNFMTDNILYFTYRTSSGMSKKVNLGYCSNRDDIRNIIHKISRR